MNRTELMDRWSKRAEDLRRLGAQVDGARIITEFLSDLTSALSDEDDELLTLESASRETGFSASHLGRLVREGKLTNAGRKHAPRIRRSDLPKKAGAPLCQDDQPAILPSTGKRQLARSVVNSEHGRNDG